MRITTTMTSRLAGVTSRTKTRRVDTRAARTASTTADDTRRSTIEGHLCTLEGITAVRKLSKNDQVYLLSSLDYACPGRCDKDGFYYKDDYSFVMCTHGITYVQRCAPGTRNGAVTIVTSSHSRTFNYSMCTFQAESYSSGGYHSHASFCDVNLVDYGYSAYYAKRGRSQKSGHKPHSGWNMESIYFW